ncbi:uncharacterized protein mslnb [Osmerus mordax]|uniref:uncharacterized protein mslnb n=1 Tax=Osmerus mordax TaxID=8014 RepID=UPI003510AD46
MTTHHLFLLIYLATSYTCWNLAAAQTSPSCLLQDTCSQVTDPTSNFLLCVGLPPSDTGSDHMHRLREIIHAALDIYSFMRSSVSRGPVLELELGAELNPGDDAFQNQDLVRLWLEVKMRPLLSSVSSHFLSCLSTKNFSCSSYHTVVSELSQHFSELQADGQRWIYMFFMYPFLSGDGVAGCMQEGEDSEDWLLKNFGSFRALARMKDFSALNMLFSGLEVLHLLTEEQKAELLLTPEVTALDNGTLSLVFQSLLGGGNHTWATPGYPPGPGQDPYSLPSPYSPPPGPQDSLREVVNGFMVAFRPIGSFVGEFVSLTHQMDVSELRSITVAQALMNWTLAELAQNYRSQNASEAPPAAGFDMTSVEAWYQSVVIPVLHRVLPSMGAELPGSIKEVFHRVFHINSGAMMDNTSALQDACSITVEERSCGLTNAVESVASVLHCAARTNLTLTQDTVMRLLIELTGRLNSLVIEFSTTNFSEVVSQYQDMFSQVDSQTLSPEELGDPAFIQLWFQIKLLPLLPDPPASLLSCLASKNFTCSVYHALVTELSSYMNTVMREDMPAFQTHGLSIYTHFLFPFLLHHNHSDPQCVSSTNGSVGWLTQNLGLFSTMASLQDVYLLNPGFSALEALEVLSPHQTAELLLLPLPVPPEKDYVINRVFDFLTESPEERKLPEVLLHLVNMSHQISVPCASYLLIFERLYRALKSVPFMMEPVIWATIDNLMQTAPGGCQLPEDPECPSTPYSETTVCAGVNSSTLTQHIGNMMEVPCHFSLEQYACAQLEGITANQLVSLLRCKLPGNGSYSKETWKLLLTKLSNVLDQALDLLSSTNTSLIGPSVSKALDVIGEMRVSLLSEDQLRDSDVIMRWFSGRLRLFLPSASGGFLHCLSSRNLSCSSYQHILMELSRQSQLMDQSRRELVVRYFIQPFLTRNSSEPGCVSSSNSSTDWLRSNWGAFSVLATLRDLLATNPLFSPLEALEVLSPHQTAELLLLPLPVPPEKDDVINRVFDFLVESPEERKLPEVLLHLVKIAQETPVSCPVYQAIFKRLYDSMTRLTNQMQPMIWSAIYDLIESTPIGCVLVPVNPQCPVSSHNATRVCAGVDSSALQQRLDMGNQSSVLCDFTITQYACARLKELTAEQLARLLRCSLAGNSSYPRETWKLFLTRASAGLDQALDLLSSTNTSLIGPSVSKALDVIGEMRVSLLSEDQLRDSDVIMRWFSGRLRLFLPSASGGFLHCLSSRNLSCSSYQHILMELSRQSQLMDQSRRELVVRYFIQPFLTRNSSEPGCVSSSNSSTDWLRSNWGAFSVLATLRDLLATNPLFSPLEALEVLSPHQTAELLLLPLPVPPEKDDVINRVFDFLTESPEERKLPEVLLHLVNMSQEMTVPCSSYRTIIGRLDITMQTSPLAVEAVVSSTKIALLQHTPQGCIVYSGDCSITSYNETEICAGVDSSALQRLLDNSQTGSVLCDHSIRDFACASLSAVTAESLAGVLRCQLSANSTQVTPGTWPANSTQARGTWKLFLYKTSIVLDAALDLLSNTTLNSANPAVTLALDAITELRLDSFTMTNFREQAFIELWFNTRLHPFLPAVSVSFLSCLSTKNFSCQTYQSLVQILSQQQAAMDLSRSLSVYIHLIQVFLTRNHTTDASCVVGSVDSGDWLLKNMGRYSALASFPDLQRLNSNFSAMEAVSVLAVRQLAEVSSTPGQLTSPAQVTMVMNNVPDHLFTSFFSDFSPAVMGHVTMLPPSVRSAFLQIIFSRGNLSNPVAVDDQEVLLWLHVRLRPLLVGMSALHVAPYFSVLAQRNCSTEQQGMELLNTTISSLHNDTKTVIFSQIVESLWGPTPLRCYGDNYNHSFYGYLESTFMGFQFPNLTTFMSLMPSNRREQLINSMPLSDLASFLRRPNSVDDNTQLCLLYSTHTLTPSAAGEDDLGVLPLYLSSNFYQRFDRATKRAFLKSFLSNNSLSRWKRKRIKTAIRQSNKSLTKRAIDPRMDGCMVGEITQIIINDDTFPFDYDVAQFNSCLSVAVVMDNLAAITANVDQEEHLGIILNKLRQAYSPTIPEMSVQVLGPASRLATSDDISMWNITKIDTLSALMNPADGDWSAPMAKAIISKYLSSGRSLGSAELTAIGGANLCSLDASVLQSITPDSLSKAPALSQASCSQEKKSILFTIATSAFSRGRAGTVSPTSYQLTQPYLGGATPSYIKSLSASNISMDMATFTSLSQDTVLAVPIRPRHPGPGPDRGQSRPYTHHLHPQHHSGLHYGFHGWIYCWFYCWFYCWTYCWFYCWFYCWIYCWTYCWTYCRFYCWFYCWTYCWTYCWFYCWFNCWTY